MYTIRNINRIYSTQVAEVVLNITSSNPFSTCITNEVVRIDKGVSLSDEDLRKAVVQQHSLVDTDLTFEAPPAPSTPTAE